MGLVVEAVVVAPSPVVGCCGQVPRGEAKARKAPGRWWVGRALACPRAPPGTPVRASAGTGPVASLRGTFFGRAGDESFLRRDRAWDFQQGPRIPRPPVS